MTETPRSGTAVDSDGAAIDYVPAGSGGGDGRGPTPQPGGRGGRGRGGRDDRGLLGRIVLFYRQVVAELRKVIWPTRSELLTYTTVVIVFVAAIVLIVAALDFVFTKGVLAVFG